eukprot:scaffold187_cov266-Chaetoceros_neogracile.AAC.7
MAQATEMSKPQKKVQNYMLGNDFKLFEVKAEELSLGEYFGETQYLPTFEVLIFPERYRKSKSIQPESWH